jgi:type I restriction enzyme S subunit
MRETLVKTEEFEDSPVEKIPKDWEIVSLRNEINILHGYAFKGEYFADEPPGNVLLVPGNFHRDGGLYFDDNNTKYYRGSIPDGTILENGELLIVMTDLSPRTLILGRVVLLELPFRVLHNQRIGKIVLKLPNTWDKRFLLLVMNSDTVRRNIISNATGTTVRHTSRDRIIANVVPKPPVVEEQSKIADILDTIDATIAHTSSLIAKLKQMKAGLLHDLLTRGLDENGELRDAIGHPEQFQDSPLGQIPQDWDVPHLTKEIDIVHGYAFKGEYFADSPPGDVLLVPGNFHREGGLYFDENNTKYYRGEIPEITVLDNGELLIVMTDLSPRTLILGRVVQLQLPFQVLHNQRIGKIVPKLPDTWDKRFLMLVMNSDRVRRNIISNATGTTVRHTSPDRIMANIILKPNIKEQSRIVEIIDTYDTRIRAEEAYRDKLKLQKKGLMHDLLTGKVRVKDANKFTPASDTV